MHEKKCPIGATHALPCSASGGKSDWLLARPDGRVGSSLARTAGLPSEGPSSPGPHKPRAHSFRGSPPKRQRMMRPSTMLERWIFGKRATQSTSRRRFHAAHPQGGHGARGAASYRRHRGIHGAASGAWRLSGSARLPRRQGGSPRRRTRTRLPRPRRPHGIAALDDGERRLALLGHGHPRVLRGERRIARLPRRSLVRAQGRCRGRTLRRLPQCPGRRRDCFGRGGTPGRAATGDEPRRVFQPLDHAWRVRQHASTPASSWPPCRRANPPSAMHGKPPAANG